MNDLNAAIDPVDTLKAALVRKEAERAAAIAGETDEARIAAVAAQLKPKIEDGQLSITGPNGLSAAMLFAALGPGKPSVAPVGNTAYEEADPRTWTSDEMKQFVEKFGHDAYRARLVAVAERKRNTSR